MSSRYPIVVYPRLISRKKKQQAAAGDTGTWHQSQEIDAPVMEISGTFIRSAISEGKDVSWFVPAPVWKYIREMHFYE
ncbi:MAG: hypothetical protein MZV63_62725 [Marinilabiliales bacterium]|nr:hypothetical protein [Marinilabiliales bacterium]